MKKIRSDETRKEIFKFFMRTSAPRLAAKGKLKQLKKEEGAK